MIDKKNVVDELYRKIANNDSLNSTDSSKEIERKIALSLGYSIEDIENGANLGLGCGNPIENANLTKGEIVLDLGCGKGMDVFKAVKLVGDEGFVIGVDRLNEMIEKANYIKMKKKLSNIDFRNSDVTDLKVEDNSIDCVISNCVINLCEDKTKAYSEIFRVLKAGGRISISDIIQYNALPSWVKDDPIFYATCVAGSITITELLDILRKTGFEPYTVIEEELSPEYLSKWGHKINLKEYIKRGKILAFKPK